jgi:hypothetical protein
MDEEEVARIIFNDGEGVTEEDKNALALKYSTWAQDWGRMLAVAMEGEGEDLDGVSDAFQAQIAGMSVDVLRLQLCSAVTGLGVMMKALGMIR